MAETKYAKAAKEAAEDVATARLSALEAAGATFKKIAAEFCSTAFSRIDDFVTVAEGGEIQAIPFNHIKRKKLAAIKKVREKSVITESKDGAQVYKTSQVEYELYDKMDALKYLCKLRGDEPAEKMEHSGSVVLIESNVEEP